eukprot:NODE_12269_length_1235_cov_6.868231.p1 GENE.NODE_12269_length_1235_cov_6.868231~~NODE_12269_length_1235_cov_6.868231.p1  ORF type:complete len:374 (-),score=122.20 NODE_12269_length_1235_cov_6.868231:114-1142(-)
MQGRVQKDGGARHWSRRLFGSYFPCAPRIAYCEEEVAKEPSSMPGEATSEEGPLQLEMFNREWQQISQQDNWDGFRIEAGKQVTKNLQATHTLYLGTQIRECGYIYQFGPAFHSDDQRQVIIARVGIDGSVNGRVIQKVGEKMEIKVSSNSHLKAAERNVHEGSAEYIGSDFAMQGKVAWQGAPICGGGYTQRITPSVQLAGDLMLVAVNGIMSIGQIAARWAEGKDIFTAQLSRMPHPKGPGTSHETRLNYVRKVTDRISLGTELKLTHPMQETGMSLAYEYSFRQARVQGLLDSDGKVSCSVADMSGFGFSGMIDYVQGDYKFGVVMHVLPQQEEQQPQP